MGSWLSGENGASGLLPREDEGGECMETDNLMLPVYINGRFLSQPTTGVQRYAAEVVIALDKVLGETNALRHKEKFQLLVPPNVHKEFPLCHNCILGPNVRGQGYLAGPPWDDLLKMRRWIMLAQ